MEDQITLPIEHLSYSSLSTYLSNPQQFKKNYILNIWDYKESPSAIVGKAFHKCMEMRYKGLEWDKAIQEGHKLIDEIKDAKVEWGKTGNREKIRKEYTKAVEFWRAEEPDLGETLDTEMKITTNFVLPSGQNSPLPIKTVIDRISKLEGKIRTWDYKVVTDFTEKDAEVPEYIIQSIFNYYGALAKYGEAPETHTYFEVKKSANKDGGKQVQTYEIKFKEVEHYFHLFERLYTGVVLQLADPNHIFLPNFAHQYSGEESWNDFKSEMVDLDMPTNVTHKSTLVQYTDKAKQYVESSVDNIGNENLSEQDKIIAKFLEFGIPLQFVESYEGANITLYTFKPSRGIKMATIAQYENDLALALESSSVRIAAPLLGTKYIGIEVGNTTQKKLDWNEENLLIQDSLAIPIGEDVYGKPYHIDLAKAPHLLVAGATGSGKSVFLNVAIKTLIKQNSIQDLELVLIDPKQTEFMAFENEAHLVGGIFTELMEIKDTLKWAVEEMDRRYKEFKSVKVKNIDEYRKSGFMSKIVIVIDELADLMITKATFTETIYDITKGSFTEKIKLSTVFEEYLVRLAQKSRAAGIHLILATQRPSVNVVTGVLKANLPTRVSFRVATRVDSEVVLDKPGAEQLLGNGDCLLMTEKERGLVRLQGYFL